MAQVRTELPANSDWIQVGAAGTTMMQMIDGSTVLFIIAAAKPAASDTPLAFRLTGSNDTFNGAPTNPIWAKSYGGPASVVVLQ